MTVSVSIGGATVDPEAILLNGGLQALTAVADGTVASATAVLDDPRGIYDPLELQQFVVEESDCTLSRSFTGYVYGITTSRGPYKSGAGRVHSMTIGDLNFLLHLQPLRGASAKRKRESGDTRLAWLMTTPGMAGIVFDNGLITPNAAMFGDDDYRGMYADEVLQSICVAGIGARIFYLTWDETAAAGEEITLFYSEPPSVLMSSTLKVSNLLSSIDDTITFEPYLDSELEQQGEEIYCGLYLTYGGAQDRLYTHNATTHATYFGSSEPAGLHRIGTLDLPRVGELATAQHHSNVWLNVHSGSMDTLSYTLRLPSSKVNLINAGMLLDNELTHLMGFETGAVARVNERTLSLTPDQNKYYDLVLKLSLNGVPIIGGGGGEEFPHVPCDSGAMQLVEVVNQQGSTVLVGPTVTLSGVDEGDLLIADLSFRVFGQTLVLDPPFTPVTAQQQIAPGYQNVGHQTLYRIAEAGDTGVVTSTGVGPGTVSITLRRFKGADTLQSFDEDILQADNPSPNMCGTVTPTSGPVLLIGSVISAQGDPDAYSAVPVPPAIEDFELARGGSGSGWYGHQVVTAPSGSYSMGAVITNTGYIRGYGGVLMAWTCSGASSEPPGPGQEVPWTTPLEAPDGVRTTFTTRQPFADGSLWVRVDDTDQTGAIIATHGTGGIGATGVIGGDPATRGVLAFTPETPDATAASNSLAAVHAARDAAGVGGVLRLPSGLGTYPAGMVALNGQTWNFDPGASWPTVDVDTNGVNGVTIRGGTCTGGMFLSRGTTGGHQTTLEQFHLAAGQMVTVESKNDFTFRNFDYDMNNSNPVVALWANNAADLDMNDPLIENFVGTRSGGVTTSMITARGYEGGAFTPHYIRRLRILNFDTYNGTGTGAGTQTGWFGFELKSCPDSEIGNGEAAGGEVLLSFPDSDRPNVHHNILHLRAGTGTATFGATYWAAEFANCDGAIARYNIVLNDGDAAGGLEAFNANSSSNGATVQYNSVTLANSLFGKSAVSPGGDHVVTDNRLTNVALEFTGSDSSGHPSIFERNGPDDGPDSAPTFTLAFAPRVNEVVTYRIQAR